MEGGGKIATPAGETSTPADLMKHGRSKVVGDIHNFLSDLHDTVKANTGQDLFGPNKVALQHRTIFSGSTRPLMTTEDTPYSKAIPDSTYVDKWKKREVGDFDVMAQHHHVEKDGPIEQALSPGARFGDYTVEHVKRTGQLHALIRHNKTGELHQVDFEPTRYEGGHPSAFAQESYNSHPEDMDAGLKGLMHKGLLISATKGSSAYPAREYMKNRKVPTVKREGLFSDYTYASQAGLRRKTAPIGMDADGTKVVRELQPKETEYNDNLPSVRKTIFGDPNAETQSFHGVIRSMKKHFTPQQVDHTLSFLKDEYAIDKYPREQVAKAVGILKEQMPEHIGLIQKHFPEHF